MYVCGRVSAPPPVVRFLRPVWCLWWWISALAPLVVPVVRSLLHAIALAAVLLAIVLEIQDVDT